MNSNRLKYFLVVTETESIRKAADILHISPAALSKAIKQLEYETDMTLLVPAGRGIIVTDEGKELAKRALPLIESFEKLKSEIKQKILSDKQTTSIKIGSFEVFTTHFLGPLANMVDDNAEFLLREFMPGDMEKALLERQIDYGITYIPVPTAGIEHRVVTEIEMKVYGRQQYFSKMPFSTIPFAIPVQPLSRLPSKVQGLDGWPDGQMTRLIKYRVAMMESALELCRQGRAVAYLPSFLVHLHNKTVKSAYRLQALSIPKSLALQKQAVYLVKRKVDPTCPLYKKLYRAIQCLCA